MTIPESHLAQEAVAALVDGELTAGPARRAAAHLAGCLQCRLGVQAQAEAKEALHASREVAVPGDLLSRLCAIPFTAEVAGSGGPDGFAAGPDSLTVTGASGCWDVSLTPQHPPGAGHRSEATARWLRRGVTGALAGLGLGVVALALTLPAGGAATGGAPSGPAAGPTAPVERTGVVPPVVRTITVGGSVPTASAPGGTP